MEPPPGADPGLPLYGSGAAAVRGGRVAGASLPEQESNLRGQGSGPCWGRRRPTRHHVEFGTCRAAAMIMGQKRRRSPRWRPMIMRMRLASSTEFQEPSRGGGIRTRIRRSLKPLRLPVARLPHDSPRLPRVVVRRQGLEPCLLRLRVECFTRIARGAQEPHRGIEPRLPVWRTGVIAVRPVGHGGSPRTEQGSPGIQPGALPLS